MKKEGIGLLVIGVVIVAASVALVVFKPDTQNTDGVDQSVLVREDSHAIEREGATVTIVEFADFQCPGCATAHPIMEQVLEQYPTEVTFVFRHFPLSQHKQAKLAAEAAEAADDQGKFWEMHDVLFENQDEWSNQNNAQDIFVGYATSLGLNVEQFTQALEDGAHENFVEDDQQDGLIAQVRSTPSFFINGVLYNGSLSLQGLQKEIDTALGR